MRYLNNYIVLFIIYYYTMKLSTLCYVRKNWKTLMMHRIKKDKDMHKWKWNWLWWKLEDWESPEQCAIREIKEESWLDVKSLTMKGFLTFPFFNWDVTEYVFLFLIDDFEWEIDDCEEWNLERIDNDRIFDLNLREWDRVFMKWLDQEWFFSWTFVYKWWKLVSYDYKKY